MDPSLVNSSSKKKPKVISMDDSDIHNGQHLGHSHAHPQPASTNASKFVPEPVAPLKPSSSGKLLVSPISSNDGSTINKAGSSKEAPAPVSASTPSSSSSDVAGIKKLSNALGIISPRHQLQPPPPSSQPSQQQPQQPPPPSKPAPWNYSERPALPTGHAAFTTDALPQVKYIATTPTTSQYEKPPASAASTKSKLVATANSTSSDSLNAFAVSQRQSSKDSTGSAKDSRENVGVRRNSLGQGSSSAKSLPPAIPASSSAIPTGMVTETLSKSDRAGNVAMPRNTSGRTEGRLLVPQHIVSPPSGTSQSAKDLHIEKLSSNPSSSMPPAGRKGDLHASLPTIRSPSNPLIRPPPPPEPPSATDHHSHNTGHPPDCAVVSHTRQASLGSHSAAEAAASVAASTSQGKIPKSHIAGAAPGEKKVPTIRPPQVVGPAGVAKAATYATPGSGAGATKLSTITSGPLLAVSPRSKSSVQRLSEADVVLSPQAVPTQSLSPSTKLKGSTRSLDNRRTFQRIYSEGEREETFSEDFEQESNPGPKSYTAATEDEIASEPNFNSRVAFSAARSMDSAIDGEAPSGFLNSNPNTKTNHDISEILTQEEDSDDDLLDMRLRHADKERESVVIMGGSQMVKSPSFVNTSSSADAPSGVVSPGGKIRAETGRLVGK